MQTATTQQSFSIRFAGDSGDGIQLIGDQLTFVCASEGWQVQTLPDFPAEIRAPLGTVSGVSGFQLSAASKVLYAPDDLVDVLVVFNPAGLKQALTYLKPNGTLLYNDDQFVTRDFKKAGFTTQTVEDVLPTDRQCLAVSFITQTLSALSDFELSHSEKKKSKNFYALGLVHWLLQIPLEPTLALISKKFVKKIEIQQANQRVLKAGYNFAMTTELPHVVSESLLLAPNDNEKQHMVSGIKAISLAMAFLTVRTQVPMLVAGYPITPASNILHEAAKLTRFGIELFQAEDEIAAACAALGASFAGNLALTCTSGPGLDLKAETLSLAVMAELPMVVVDVQRAGPSTGLPTKTEQSDLMMAVYGRHGESPLPVIAASSPADVFYAVIDAFKVAITSMTPVILLLDAHLANGSEKWFKPDFKALNFPEVSFAETGAPFDRLDNLSRPWIKPGTKDLMHRIGGLEKGNEQGSVTYEPEQHQKMIEVREKKIKAVYLKEAAFEMLGNPKAPTIVISWGSTKGSVQAAVSQLKQDNIELAHLHIRQIFPLPLELKNILSAYQQCFVAELNQGQLNRLIRDEFVIDTKLIGQTNGQPFKVAQLAKRIKEAL